ncbi:MAG: restriction endonuclease subunit S [Lactobacillaceae bacterium]|jgi:type I restriction enzyme S subunit|nr:restriction endonuclease subunit S [Lactobacillaceae bacterium]
MIKSRKTIKNANSNIISDKSNIERNPKFNNGYYYSTIKDMFKLQRGIVINTKLLNADKNKYPVYSSKTQNDGILGYLNTYMYDGEYISWTTDGKYAGTVFLRDGKFNITNVCGVMIPKTNLTLNKYIYYFLKSISTRYARTDILGYKMMSHDFEIIPLKFPQMSIQQRIIDIIEPIENLISTCNKIIKNISSFEQNLLKRIDTNDKIEFSNLQNIKIISSGIKPFSGQKEYIDTSCIQDFIQIKNGLKISYDNRPSRANMLPIKNSF